MNKSYLEILVLLLLNIRLTRCDNKKFMILPLKSLKKNNIDLPFDNPLIRPYLPEDLSKPNFMNEWYTKCIYSEIIVGIPNQKYILDFVFTTSNLKQVITRNFQRNKTYNFYNISSSYKNITELKIFCSYCSLTRYGTVKDIFYF